MIDFVATGLSANSVPYLEGLDLQRATHAAVVAGLAPGTVIVLGLPLVYTTGKRTETTERPTNGTPVIDARRRGQITWHGPGQLVGYLILRLPDPIDVVRYVRRLEDIIIGDLAELGEDGRHVEGRSGVWMSRNDYDEKVAAIGIRVAAGVTLLGFSINSSNSFEAHEHIVTCGIRDADVTSIRQFLSRRVDRADMIPLPPDRFIDTFRRAA